MQWLYATLFLLFVIGGSAYRLYRPELPCLVPRKPHIVSEPEATPPDNMERPA